MNEALEPTLTISVQHLWQTKKTEKKNIKARDPCLYLNSNAIRDDRRWKRLRKQWKAVM